MWGRDVPVDLQSRLDQHDRKPSSHDNDLSCGGFDGDEVTLGAGVSILFGAYE
jgi:hypothetical protein